MSKKDDGAVEDARRREGKTVVLERALDHATGQLAGVRDVLEFERAERAPKPIKPLDFGRCQAEISNGVTFMTLGGRKEMIRCDRKPANIVEEIRPGKDGQRGHMTLCESCSAVFRAQNPDWRTNYTITDILDYAKALWDSLPAEARAIFESHGMKRPG